MIRIITLFLIFSFFLCIKGNATELKNDQQNIAANKRANGTPEIAVPQRKSYLVLKLVGSLKTRYHGLSALKRTMSPSTAKEFRDQATFLKVDLRRPLEVKVFENLDFTLSSSGQHFTWQPEQKAYFYKGRKMAYDHSESVSQNFERMKRLLSKRIAIKTPLNTLMSLLLPSAEAQDLNQTIFDLNYLLYVRSRDEQTLINELGTEYIAKATTKMERVVQNNQFLRMECNYGAHSMEAVIVMGDGTPGNEIRLVAQDTGTGSIATYIEENGQRRSAGNRVSTEAGQLLQQNVFNEVCLSMNAVELDQYSQDLYYYGSNGSDQ